MASVHSYTLCMSRTKCWPELLSPVRRVARVPGQAVGMPPRSTPSAHRVYTFHTTSPLWSHLASLYLWVPPPKCLQYAVTSLQGGPVTEHHKSPGEYREVVQSQETGCVLLSILSPDYPQ